MRRLARNAERRPRPDWEDPLEAASTSGQGPAGDSGPRGSPHAATGRTARLPPPCRAPAPGPLTGGAEAPWRTRLRTANPVFSFDNLGEGPSRQERQQDHGQRAALGST